MSPQAQPYRVVAIGGGTGLSTLLKGLKRYTVAASETPPAGPYVSDLTAIVTVSDDGGSSGRLRRELNMLPPGDVRNCLVAVSQDENLLSKLFQYRFSSSGELEGHSFGNLFLAAMTAMTGDFAAAVKKASEILATRGHILPATSANVELEAVNTNPPRLPADILKSADLNRKVIRDGVASFFYHPYLGTSYLTQILDGLVAQGWSFAGAEDVKD